MLQLFRLTPGLIICFALLVGGGIVCAGFAIMVNRGGASLRPIVWLSGMFFLIVIPQFIAQLALAITATKNAQPRLAALDQVASAPDPQTRQSAAKLLFGSDADPQLILDARGIFGGVFADAQVAQLATLPKGESVLLARFKSSSAAEKAWSHYIRANGLNLPDGKGDSHRGFAVTRPGGDRVYVWHRRNLVGVWSAAGDAAICDRMLAGGFEVPRRAPLSMADGAKLPGPGRGFNPALVAGALGIYMLVVVISFFKGAAWAGSVLPKPGVVPNSLAELARRLEAINQLDVPYRIERGAQPNEFFATWHYADAKWLDLARARGMKRTFRIRLVLDEKEHVVRATDFNSALDWSAGSGGMAVNWKSTAGIVFFQQDYQRVFGLQMDEIGRFKPELSYTYNFSLQELKSPLIMAVTGSGWKWRPTVWQGPAALRWITE